MAAWAAVLVWMLLSEAQTICPSWQEYAETAGGALAWTSGPVPTHYCDTGSFILGTPQKKKKKGLYFYLYFISGMNHVSYICIQS